jgi:hypothetical protein
MTDNNPFALIVPENFIQAFRDSGYKSPSSAMAELVDNSFEASATQVSITVEKLEKSGEVRVTFVDNGQAPA